MNSMDFAAAVERELAGALARPEPETLRCAARHLCFSSAAKRARPLLVERFGALLGTPPERLIAIAAAAELIHSASLLHDDVIDAASERRGIASANAVYGNRVAVLAGDLLIAVALDLLRPQPKAVTAAAVETIAAMTRAAMWEIEGARDPALDERGWRRIAAGKTGALLAFCGRAVGLEAGDEPAAEALATAGAHLGVAFQAADDLADAREGTGKPRFQDVRHGNPSVLTVTALAHDPSLAEDVAAVWSQADDAGLPWPLAESLGERIAAGPARGYVKRLIAAEVEAATAALGPWLTGPHGAAVLAWGSALLDEQLFVTAPAAIAPAGEASP